MTRVGSGDVFVRTSTRKNSDGTRVSYLQLVHNEWDAAAKTTRAKVLYSFGRVDQLDRPAIERLITALTLWGSRTRLQALTFGSGCAFVLVDQASQDRSAFDPLAVKIRTRMIGVWWLELQCAMWAPPVVVGAELGEDGPQVPLPEDQDAVGELGSGGQDEAFGEAVGSGTARRDLDGVDPCAGLDGVECGGELVGSVADKGSGRWPRGRRDP